MLRSRTVACVVTGAIGVAAVVIPAPAIGSQSRPSARRDPPPQGQRIEARDGDMIVLDDDARVQIVHRKHGVVRAVYDSARGWLILLLDAQTRQSSPDGTVDWSYRFAGVSGDWPLGDRWEGTATIEQYRPAGTGPSAMGTVLETSAATISFPSPPGDRMPREATVHMRHKNGGNGSTPNLSFEAAEQQQLVELARDSADTSGTIVSRTSSPAGGQAVMSTTLTPSSRRVRTTPGQLSDGAPAHRVGGRIATPRKVHDVPPVYPEQARSAGIAGVVIVEATIDATGMVTAAKILRGQQLLDEAALAAVRQWRYEPTMLNGAAVPVVMTVSVAVPPSR
jgi:TonB family protein